MANPINPNLLKLLIGKSPSTISYANNVELFHEDLYLKNFISSAFYSLNFHPSDIIIHKTPTSIITRLQLYANPTITPNFKIPTVTLNTKIKNLYLMNNVKSLNFSHLFYPLSLLNINYISYNSFIKSKKNHLTNNIILHNYLNKSQSIPTKNKLKQFNLKINKLLQNNKEFYMSQYKPMPYKIKKLSYILNIYNKKYKKSIGSVIIKTKKQEQKKINKRQEYKLC